MVFFLFGGVVPVFSQQILATFGIGGQFLDHDDISLRRYLYDYNNDGQSLGYTRYIGTVSNGTTIGVNVLFIGRVGFTISSGIDMIFNVDEGLNVDPIIGLGYIHYNNFYVGGIFNFIPKSYMFYRTDTWGTCEIFISPTLVGGYDLGGLIFGGQLGYMRGILTNVNGLRFSINVGVNVGDIIK